MSIKLLVVLSLVTVAASSPAPLPAIELPGISIGGSLGGILGIQIGSLDLGKELRDLFSVLIGQKQTARTELEAILSLKVSSFIDVCTLLSKVVVSVTDTIEASITGLGNLLARVIISLLKIVICIVGGAGGNNPICGTDINLLVGVQASAAANVNAVINLFGVANCKARLNDIIAIYTKGRGISACRGSVRTIFTVAINLVNRLQVVIDGSGSLVRGDFKLIFRGIIAILGSIGNSRQKGLGLQIAKNFVSVCNTFVILAGYPDFGLWADIQIDIDAGNDDNAPWAISDLDASVNAGVSLSLGGLIGKLLKGLLGVTRLAVNLIQDIIKIVIITVDDVFYLALKIILGLGGVLDAIISGLGSLLVRIVAGLLKIVLCFIGTGKYGVCSSSWETQVGVSGSVTSIDLVIQLYGLVGCRAQVDKYIYDYTNGAGIGSISGSLKILLQSCQTLADIVEAKKWSASIVVIVFRHITYLLGAIGNSNAKGVGTAVCNKFIPACDKYLSDAGYPGLGVDLDVIITIVEQANNDNYCWTADIDTSDGKTGFIIIGGSVEVSTGVSVSGTGLIGGLIKGIFGTITGVVNLALTALGAVLNITIGALTDVFSLIFNLSLVLKVTLNNLVAGLGSLFVRLVAVILKIAICIHGLPGDKGICAKGWNSNFGISGEASTAADLIILFGVNNAEAELNEYIIKITGGKGISSTSGSIKIVLEKITTLVIYAKNYNQITKETVTDTFVILATVSGCISNSRKTDSGKEIVQKIVPECGKYLVQQGYPDITVKISIIIQECSSSNGDNVDWDGNGNGTGGNTGTTGGDNGSSIDFGISISALIKLIPGVASITANIINDIISIKINTIIGIINLITKLAIALGGIIDSIISGLGSILIRIVAVIFKIGYCVNGWGPERSICTKEWNAQFGITGEATTATDLINLYRLGNCKSDVEIIVAAYTKGLGIASTSGFIKIILQQVTDLSVIVSSQAFTIDAFSIVFIKVISIYGSITNSYKQGSGTSIIQQIIPVCGPLLQKEGSGDISSQLDSIVSTINVGNNDKFDWTVVKNGGDSISDKLVSKIKEIFTAVEIKNNVSAPSLTAILNIQPPNNFDDVCSFGVQVVLGLGGILDIFITGLGTLIARIVGALINFIVAVLGAVRNAKSFVSQNGYYASFGVSVSAKTWAAISAGFKITNAKADLDLILSVYTSGNGLKSLSGIKLVLFNAAYTLVNIVLKGAAIVEADLTIVFRVVTTIIGGFANSISVNAGKTICDNLLPTVSFYLEQNGYLSLASDSDAIYSEIETCNNSDAPWARG